MTTRDHILQVPAYVLYLRFVQAGFALIILALSAFGLSVSAFDGDSLMLYASLSCMIIAVYNIVAVMATPIIYNYWAVLGLDIYQFIIWLTAMGLLASEVSANSSLVRQLEGLGGYDNPYNSGDGDNCFYGYCYKKRSLERRLTVETAKSARNALAAACGLAGLEMILFIITLVFLSLALHRHRQAGGHCIPSSGGLIGPRAVTNEPKAFQGQPQQQQPGAQYQEPQYAPVAPQPQYAPVAPQPQYAPGAAPQQQPQGQNQQPQYTPVPTPQQYAAPQPSQSPAPQQAPYPA